MNNFTIQVAAARQILAGYLPVIPLQFHARLSAKYQARIYLKREDLQPVRSYKVRGALHKILSLTDEQRAIGVSCASAGNHAQGVAYTCELMGIEATIFMPANTPDQKIRRVRSLGADNVKIVLHGESYDEAAVAAIQYSKKGKKIFIPPFDDLKIIEGQATVATEILEELTAIDYLFVPIGGGGLAAGVGAYFKVNSAQTIIVGAEPAGAASMAAAFEAGKPVTLERIDSFIDGAAVRQVGSITYELCRDTIDRLIAIPEGKVCATLLQLYNDDGIVTEPAGALSVAALDDYADDIKGKVVVCVISGGNNDSNRFEEIKKLADAWEGSQHYLVVRFQHYPDGLTHFFTEALGPQNYVNRIEYFRRDHGRSTYALVGVRSASAAAYAALTERLREKGTEYKEVERNDFLFKYWV